MKLGIDTGGTFTDFILLRDGKLSTWKTSSTPDDPSRAILAGILHFFPGQQDPEQPQLPPHLEIIHGTTVATNAFLQRRGAKTLLITTRGFEDVLFIGRQNRGSLYDLDIEKAPEIISRDLCTGVSERLRHDGQVEIPLAKSSGKRLRAMCRRLGIESVAVCLLHSYANDDHELQLARQLAQLSIPISLSSQVLPEFREYERMTTTLINAYLAPIISSYIDKLARKLGGARLSIQQSNGGVLPAVSIGERSVHTVLSGPAGGVHGAFQLACQVEIDKLITFDMGGTSTDVSLCNGKPALTRDYSIDTFPVRIQLLDIHTVGAGGGSIAWIDQGGLLHVGPRSAGADPGPVCYGKGEELTVTDANLFLGRLRANRFLGGEMLLSFERVSSRMEQLGKELGLSAEQAALGIIRLVNVGMARAVRAVSLERGYDPKDFVLFSFGGASGLHCCELARDLGMRRILIPARAGILSAQGMVGAEPMLDGSRALFISGDQLRRDILDQAFFALIEAKRQEMEGLTGGGGELLVECFVDTRYQGQSHELSVAYDHGFPHNFHALHEQQFGYALHDHGLEIVSIRCRVKVRRPSLSLPKALAEATSPPVPQEHATVIFRDGPVRLPIFARQDLTWGHKQSGPALFVDDYTTILLPPGFSLTVDDMLNFIISW